MKKKENAPIYSLRTQKALLKLILFLSMFGFSEQYLFSQFEIVWKKTMPNLIQIDDVKFSHDSKSLLCLAPDLKKFQIYAVPSGELLNDQIPIVNQPFFSNDDSYIYGILGNHIAKYNISTVIDESIFEPMDNPTDIPIINTTMSQDEKYFLSTTKEGFKVWDVQTGKIIKEKKIFPDTAHSTAYSQVQISCDNSKIFLYEDKRYLIGKDPKGNPIYNYTEKVNIYDFNSLDSVGNLHNWKTGDNAPSLASFAISATCQYVAIKYAGSVTNPIKIYNLNTMQLISSFPYAEDLKFSSDDKYLVTASAYQNNLIVWDIKTGKQLNKEVSASFETVEISTNSQYIATSMAEYLYLKQSSLTGVTEKPNTEETLFPNPTTGLISIRVNLPESSVLSASLKDINGTDLGILYNDFVNQGENSLQFDMSLYPAGTYFITLNALQFSKKLKIIVIK